MPTIEVTIGRLREEQKRQIARGIAGVLMDAGIPRESIRIIFRHVSREDVAVEDGRFPYWPEESDAPPTPTSATQPLP
jgi:phenylpyruvate tautomerase PptA (4-oxalocrotonate tautomerase family)